MAGKVHPFFDQSNFWLTLATAVTLGISSGALGDWLHDDMGLPRFWIWGPTLSLFIVLGYVVWAKLGETYDGPLRINPDNPVPAAGLIAMVSKGPGSQTARDAIAYHGAVLRHLWLLTTSEARADAEAIVEDTRTRFPQVTTHPIEYLANPNDIEAAAERVSGLRLQALRRQGLTEGELICDFTGLTKAASAGMVLACAHRAARLQYMIPDWREADTLIGRGPSKPVEVPTSFVLSRE